MYLVTIYLFMNLLKKIKSKRYSNINEDIDEEYEFACELLTNKRYNKALELLHSLHKKDKSHIKTITKLGIMYRYGWGINVDMNKAIEYYEKACLLDKDNVDILFELAYMYQTKLASNTVVNDNKKALKYYNKILALNNNYRQAIKQLSKLCFFGDGVKNYNLSEYYAEQYLIFDETDSDILYLLGKINIAKRKHKDAFKYLEKAVYYSTNKNEDEILVTYLYLLQRNPLRLKHIIINKTNLENNRK